MTRMQEAMTLHEGNGCASVTAEDLARQDTLDLSRCHGCVLRLGDLHGFANLRELSLAGNGLKTLPSRVFAGLSKLRVLDLSNNQLSALPPGLFEGLAELAEVDLSDNPGAPFTLAVDLVRQDAEPSQPTAATVALHVAEGRAVPDARSNGHAGRAGRERRPRRAGGVDRARTGRRCTFRCPSGGAARRLAMACGRTSSAALALPRGTVLPRHSYRDRDAAGAVRAGPVGLHCA